MFDKQLISIKMNTSLDPYYNGKNFVAKSDVLLIRQCMVNTRFLVNFQTPNKKTVVLTIGWIFNNVALQIHKLLQVK